MKEIKGNIWDYHEKGHWIVITTNGTVKANGKAVMGSGIALQAKERFPELPELLGDAIKDTGNIGHFFLLVDGQPCHIITLPVKHNWWEKANMNLIEEACKAMARWATRSDQEPIYMVRPGCGSGGLDWKDVKPILEKYLDDRFVIVERI